MLPLKSETETAFTLIEISVVLVIIGLIVGGILAGEGLISAARQRAFITQMQQYNAAVDDFRAKYVGIPGDLLYSKAAAFGLAATTSGGPGMGDGNGKIQDPGGANGGSDPTDNSTPTINTPVGEILLFWRQLSDAGMIDGGFGSDLTVATAQGPATITPGKDFPAAKIGRYNYVVVGTDSTPCCGTGLNYFATIGFIVNGISGGAYGSASYWWQRLSGFTPIEAYNIDLKMDDGYPNSGIVNARGSGSGDPIGYLQFNNSAYWNSTPMALACVIGGSDYVHPAGYNLYTALGGNNVNCGLRFQFN